jgi:peptidyl-prolyl cis-trans isomerase C
VSADPRAGEFAFEVTRLKRDVCEVNNVKLSALIALITAVGFYGAVAQAAPETVVAKVNGQNITEAEVEFAEAEIGSELASVPDANRRRLLVEYLIEAHLMAEAAEKSGLTNGKEFEARMEYYRLRAIRDAYFELQVRDAVPEEEAKALYDERVKSLPSQEEVHARHILVESEDEAKNVRKELEAGGDFAELAQKYSKDRGGQDGGDLGYFTRGQMVKPFEDVAFALEKGILSEPVKSDFGWHLIKVEDKRDREPPAFDQVKDQIKASLIQSKLQGLVQGLRADAKIELVDASLKTPEEVAAEKKGSEANAEQLDGGAEKKE